MNRKNTNEQHLRARIFDAIDLRSILIPPEDNGGRLIHGDGDNLRGLTVEAYDQYLLIEITTSTMWELKKEIIDTLNEVLIPKGMLIKDKRALSDSNLAPSGFPTIHGEEPCRQNISSGGLLYSVDLKRNTLHFFDQNENRRFFAKMVEGYKVLDTFCYSGSWGMEAARSGATEVTFIDSDPNAIELTEVNWMLNELTTSHTAIKSETLPFLKECQEEGRKFDAIVIDPPVTLDSFDEIVELNGLAIELLHKGGLLVSSCYQPQITFDKFSVMIGKSASKIQKFAKIIKFGHQSSAFPVAANFPESSYLKCLFTRIY